MTGTRSRRRWSLEELAAFARRPDVRRITDMYADWMRSSEGMMMNMRIIGFVIGIPADDFDEHKLRRYVGTISRECSIPRKDLMIIAECTVRNWYAITLGAIAQQAGVTEAQS